MAGTFVQWLDRQSWFHQVVRLMRIRSLASLALRIRPVVREYSSGARVAVAALESFYLSDEIFQRETYRRALMMAGNVHTIVDLGCNVGFFCSYLRHFLKRHDFQGLGIDANPQVLEKARRNLELNELSGIELRLGLVGGSEEYSTQDFYVYASHLGSSQFLQPEEGRTLKGNWTKITVPVLKVSKLWREKHGDKPIDLLKVDIEGSEAKLLRSDPALFQQTKSIVLEWHKWLVTEEELLPLLKEAGFIHQELLDSGKNTELWFFSRGSTC